MLLRAASFTLVLNLGQTMGLIWVLDCERNLFALVLNLGQTMGLIWVLDCERNLFTVGIKSSGCLLNKLRPWPQLLYYSLLVSVTAYELGGLLALRSRFIFGLPLPLPIASLAQHNVLVIRMHRGE